MNNEYISGLCSEINRRLELVSESIKENNKQLDKKVLEVEAEAESLKTEMRSKVESKIETDLASLISKLNNLLSELTKSSSMVIPNGLESGGMARYNLAVDQVIDDSEKLSVQQNWLYACIAQINECIGKLNDLSFDDLNPPSTITVSEDILLINKGNEQRNVGLDAVDIRLADLDTKPDNDLLVAISSEIQLAKTIADDIRITFRTIMDQNEYFSYVNSYRDGWISEERAATNTDNDNVIYEHLVRETDILNKSTFTRLEEEGMEYDSNLKCGSSEFSKAITIGKLEINVTDNPEYHKLISDSPLLKNYLANGKLSVPHILDLTKNGNIWLNVNEEKYSDDTFRFIHQIILQFLLAFPAGRLNLCLIDVDEVGDFARYTTLKSINSEMLCGGVVRDRRELADTLRKMGEKGFDIYGEISASNCYDIYDYNEVSRENPKSFHLVVLLNYPSGMRDDENGYLKRLMNYNHSGIFTFVVNNQSCELPSHIKPEDQAQTIKRISEDALVIHKVGSFFTVENPFDHVYYPRDGISFENFREIADLLQKNEKAVRYKPILLDEMFEETDRQDKASLIVPSSELLDIPIGKSGANIQNMLFDTTGEGSAHAVVIGGTGSGKSNLLHTIIMNACYKYSPEELNVYLVDFKGGVEFQFYEAEKDVQKQIPHIKLTGLTSEPEDGVAILSNMQLELRRREALFSSCGVEDIIQYRLKFPEDSMPRILLIIDEIQELFESDARLGDEAINILSQLFKKGRAFGINILWASQNIPKVPGLKDKVLSQAGNRISLRLNNPSDAEDVGIKADKVRTLNRPEKGLGLLMDIRTGNDSNEFRVAYAYDSKKRGESSHMIIEKWQKLLPSLVDRDPLFIVGNRDAPSSQEVGTKYTSWKTQIVANTCSMYHDLNLGQNYITGKPYDVSFGLRESRMNAWIAGSNSGEIRDIMGYALLSAIINNVGLSQNPSQSIYYYNGEYKDPEDPRDLYYVIPEMFPKWVSERQTTDELIETVRQLYLMRRERARNMQMACSPVFVFIHKLQSLTELFQSTRLISLNEPYAVASQTSSKATASVAGITTDASKRMSSVMSMLEQTKNYNNSSSQQHSANTELEKMSFKEMFKELLARGSDVGIHFVLSMDSPQSVRDIISNLSECRHKIVLKGVSETTLTSVLDTYKGLKSLDKEGIAFHYNGSDLFKFKPYRYESKTDERWLIQLRDDLEQSISRLHEHSGQVE